MDTKLASDFAVTDADRSIVDAFLHERGRLRRFIRRRVPAAAHAEDILQEVFFELVEAARLLKPVEHVGAWLFRVARNRIIDPFRKKQDRYERIAGCHANDGNRGC